ncbi:MAG: hypothetical protein ABEJ88_04650 [Halobacterium sp.]
MTETVTLRALETERRDESYPQSGSDVREAFGDYVLDLPAGEERVADVLDRVDVDEYADAAAAVASIQTGVGREAVGTSKYSDRGGTAGERDPASF